MRNQKHHPDFKKCRLAITIAAVASISSFNAFAEEAATGALAEEVNKEVAVEDSSYGIEEVVVTARKRDERLSEVPSSVSVITEADTERLVLDDMGDYLRQLPSATLVSGGPDYLRDISIRGQGGGRLGFSESATGIYRNGMYVAGGGYGGRSLSRMDFFDMANLEVYSGPQGALYGRNAVGGAVNAVSHRPVDEFEGKVKVAPGSNGKQQTEFVVNTPGSDQFAFRIGGYWDDQTKGQTTLADTGEYLDYNDQNGIRTSMAFTPSDELSLAVTVEHSNIDAPSFTSLGYRATTALGTELDPDPFVLDMKHAGRVEIEKTSSFVELDLESELFDVHAGFNASKRKGKRLDDDLGHYIGWQSHPALGEIDIIQNQTEDFKRFGGDVYLTSNGDSALQWLAGIEYQSYTSDLLTITDGVAKGPFAPQLRTDVSTEEMNSGSVFGSVDYALNEQLTLSVEGRVQQDDKSIDFVRTPNEDLGAPAAGAIDVNMDASWTKTLFGTTLSYQLADDQMLFGRLSSGYRPGGFNTVIPIDVPNATDMIAYEPEFVRSSELGWKGSMFGGLLQSSVSVYYSQTDDVQGVDSPSATEPGYILQNHGDHEVWGLEFETRGHYELDYGMLVSTLGLSSNDGEWKHGTALENSVPVDLEGLRVTRTRDLLTNLNLSYIFPVAHLQALVSASYQSATGGFEDAVNSREMADYELFDLRASISGAQWEASIYGKNLTDEVYITQTVAKAEYFSQGRSFGASLSYHF